MICDYYQDDYFLKEEDFLQRMTGEIEPFMQENCIRGDMVSFDQTQIRYYILKNPDEKAAIVACHGFCEFFGKFSEILYYLYKAGYSVFFVEHRGHGHSQRFTEDMDKVHLTGDFHQYVDDLKYFVDHYVIPQSTTGKLYLYAHSMGGAIGAMFLEKYPEVFERAVLSSPMIEANYAGLPIQLVRCLMGVSKILKWDEKWAPGQSPFDGSNHFETSCSESKARYDYVLSCRLKDPFNRTNGGSYAWGAGAVKSNAYILKNAAKVKIPVLLIQAGRDDLVMPAAQEKFASLSGNTSLIRFENSKHEIFNGKDEVVRDYFRKVLEFYDTGYQTR